RPAGSCGTPGFRKATRQASPPTTLHCAYGAEHHDPEDSDADTSRAGREDGQAFSVLQEARNDDHTGRGSHHLPGPDTDDHSVLSAENPARKYPSGRAGGADHHGIPGSGAVLPCAHTAVLFRQAPGHACGFRAGNHFASARKDLPVHGITQARPRRKASAPCSRSCGTCRPPARGSSQPRLNLPVPLTAQPPAARHNRRICTQTTEQSVQPAQANIRSARPMPKRPKIRSLSAIVTAPRPCTPTGGSRWPPSRVSVRCYPVCAAPGYGRGWPGPGHPGRRADRASTWPCPASSSARCADRQPPVVSEGRCPRLRPGPVAAAWIISKGEGSLTAVATSAAAFHQVRPLQDHYPYNSRLGCPTTSPPATSPVGPAPPHVRTPVGGRRWTRTTAPSLVRRHRPCAVATSENPG